MTLTADDHLATKIDDWDADFVQRVISVLRPAIKRWFRSEVRGLEQLPSGGALLVSNHSGGLLTVDVPVLAADFYHHFGYDRPLYTLSHDALLVGPTANLLRKLGFISANHENASAALRSGDLVIVFPGGDFDVYRPTRSQNVVDFGGRTGYVKAAMHAGVPIVPVVSIGGQESQLFITRGDRLARTFRLDKLLRSKVLPFSFGFPFGPSAVIPPNIPLPTKIVTEVLAPIDIEREFGPDADPSVVDCHVRKVMQCALDQLAAKRRYPILG